MKRLIFILLLFCSISISATTYQIANQSAFDLFNWSSLVAGDQVQLAKGQSFYGSITLSQSGAAGNPITVTSYGTGANPIITGLTSVTAWTNLGSNIWESTNSVSTLSTCNMVTVNGINTAMGRYPNADAANGGYLTFQSHVGHTSITTSGLTGTPNWTGAEVVVRTSHWTINRDVITSQSLGTLNYVGMDGYEPQNGFGLFIQNDARTLDQQNEWYYNPSTKKIRIYSTSSPTNIKIASVDNLITVNGNYITIDGIDLLGANLNAVYSLTGGRSNCIIQNCNLSLVGKNAILFRCNTLSIANNTISNSNDTGISTPNSTYVTIRNNVVQNIGLLIGMGADGNGTRHGISCVSSDNSTIEYNSIINIGYIGIEFYGNIILVKNNFIDSYCSVLDDGGGIYTYAGTQTPIKTDQIVTGNIVISGIGAPYGTSTTASSVTGIYLDENANDVEVIGNTIANSYENGIFLHNTHYCNISGNTVYNSKADQVLFKDNDNTATNNIIQNNIFVAGLTSSTRNSFYRASQGTVINSSGTVDNNYYVQFESITNPIAIYTQNIAYNSYTLAYWQSNSGFDINSSLSPYSITSANDLYLAYNTNTTVQNIAIPAKYKDLLGVEYNGIIELQPYSSKVLFYVSPAMPVRTKGISAGSGKMWGVGGVPYGL